MTHSTNRSTHETTTIQTWPGGESYTYRGDPERNANQRSLRRKSFLCSACSVKSDRYPACGHSAAFITETRTWRKGTAAEWRTIRIAIRAEMYQRNYVLQNQCALVSTLINAVYEIPGDFGEAWRDDAIRNLYPDPSDWSAEQCREYLASEGIDHSDIANTDDDAINDDEGFARIEHLRERCRDYAQDHPAEVYEWYLVDPWLCARLDKIGEVTIDNEYGCWWGRQTTGQALIMDGTLQRIAAEYVNSVGGL